jgi:lipopolysaccharide transport system ATP-binding protein
MSTVIQLENISKLYRLGTISSGTVRDDFSRWWAKINKKDDPFQKIGERNIQNTLGKSDHIWALKDINLDAQEGDVLGIIGKNGAGKSTLLKILSRITSPTTGITKIKGRIASLLEVGTGFHPDLTGRENIYLNGAILGMTKREITEKLDEIIYFSGIERYIYTPVKRYSSGMYVRLAFAVAAHLEPEILLIDEVLAVGDISFQAKCLRKMDSIAKQGRTVLFVSHNIGAISSLCTRCLLLDNGKVGFDGNVNDATKIYLQVQNKDLSLEWNGDSGDENLHLLRTWVRSMDKEGIFHTSSDIEIGIEINILKDIEGLILGFTLSSYNI